MKNSILKTAFLALTTAFWSNGHDALAQKGKSTQQSSVYKTLAHINPIIDTNSMTLKSSDTLTADKIKEASRFQINTVDDKTMHVHDPKRPLVQNYEVSLLPDSVIRIKDKSMRCCATSTAQIVSSQLHLIKNADGTSSEGTWYFEHVVGAVAADQLKLQAQSKPTVQKQKYKRKTNPN